MPVPGLIGRVNASAVVGVTALDADGRIADRVVMGALGWRPGTRVRVALAGGSLMLTADSAGQRAVSGRGHLHLPAPMRHACALAAGDRVLLVAVPTQGVLAVHPPAALGALIPAPIEDRPGVRS
jgi:hypothetical protein